MSKAPAVSSAPTFEFSAATAAEFERALSCAVTTESDSMCALESAVGECARELEAAGATPEAMVVRVKTEFRAVARKYVSTTGPTMRIEDHVLAKVVRWAIVAYFEAAAIQTA
jgi:hypothetical protein